MTNVVALFIESTFVLGQLVFGNLTYITDRICSCSITIRPRGSRLNIKAFKIIDIILDLREVKG